MPQIDIWHILMVSGIVLNIVLVPYLAITMWRVERLKSMFNLGLFIVFLGLSALAFRSGMNIVDHIVYNVPLFSEEAITTAIWIVGAVGEILMTVSIKSRSKHD